MTAPRDDRSLGELFGELSQQTSNLVKKEIELARHEMTRSVTDLARNSAMIAVGGVVAYAGAIVVLFGIAYVLAQIGVPLWLSLLLVGGLTAAIGGFLAYRAVNAMKTMSVVPTRTVETIKEDVEWAKEQSR